MSEGSEGPSQTLLPVPEVQVHREEREIKYSINPENLPDDLKDALINGGEHEAIKRKGRITQIYLKDINVTTLRKAVAIIKRIAKENGEHISEDRCKDFLKPENVSEIRILQKEQDHIGPSPRYEADRQKALKADRSVVQCPDAFQITIKGIDTDSGESRNVLETKITDDKNVAKGVVELLESRRRNQKEKLSWLEKVKILEKMWYDIEIDAPEEMGGGKLTVELDFFPDLDFIAIGEIEFTEEQAPFIEKFKKDHLPAWFETDLTDNVDFRSRKLAGDPAEVMAKEEINSVVAGVRDKIKNIHIPTVLGNMGFSQEESKGKKFVFLGSFMKFLPQFRRMQQDIARQSEGAYPPINTLDIARRQADTEDDEDGSFRIEVQEDEALAEAEKNYLTKIENSDAVFVVCPEGRLGATSTQEMIHAVWKGKDLYFGTKPERVSAKAPFQIKTLVQVALLEIVAGMPDFDRPGATRHQQRYSSQNFNFTPVIRQYFTRVTGGDLRSMKELLEFNYESCISGQEASEQMMEEKKRKADDRNEQEPLPLVSKK